MSARLMRTRTADVAHGSLIPQALFDSRRIESKKTDRRSRSMLEGRWRDSMGAIELRRQL